MMEQNLPHLICYLTRGGMEYCNVDGPFFPFCRPNKNLLVINTISKYEP
jgi:hypothetical protein